jgi:hypothetical protein
MQLHFPDLKAAGFEPCKHHDATCPMLNVQAFERAWNNLDVFVRPSEIR